MSGYVPSLAEQRKHLLKALSVLCSSDEDHYTDEQVRFYCCPFTAEEMEVQGCCYGQRIAVSEKTEI